MNMVDGKVEPKEVYYPKIITLKLFKTWAIQCGKCEKDFVRFSFIGRPKCPYCGVVNIPRFGHIG